jgi:hypothetical protein
LGDVRFGSKADICAAKSDVRFTPNSDRKSGFLRVIAIKECERSTDITAALN